MNITLTRLSLVWSKETAHKISLCIFPYGSWRPPGGRTGDVYWRFVMTREIIHSSVLSVVAAYRFVGWCRRFAGVFSLNLQGWRSQGGELDQNLNNQWKLFLSLNFARVPQIMKLFIMQQDCMAGSLQNLDTVGYEKNGLSK
jgi:hypothetical protein